MKTLIKHYLPKGAVKQVATEFGVSHTLVSLILNEKRKPIDSKILKRLIQIAIKNKKNVIEIKESVDELYEKLKTT